MRKSTLILITLIILAGSISFEGVSHATDYYVAQNSTGGNTGGDCSNAYSATWFNTAANWGSGAGKINPGDTVHLCGTFTGSANSNMLSFKASGTADHVTTVLFEPGAILQAPYWGTSGAISCAAKNYIKIDGGTNGIIQNTANGSVPSGKTYHAASYGIYISGCSNIEVANLTIKNIFINTGGDNPAATDSYGLQTAGIRVLNSNGNYSNISIHNNTVSNARANIWFEYDNITISNVNIYKNTISDQGWGINIGAGSNNSVASNISVHDNDISNWNLWQYPSSSYHTDGLIIYSNGATNATYSGAFYNNYAHGDLGDGSPTAFIQMGCGGKAFMIFNNVFACSSSSSWGACTSVWHGGECTGGIQPSGTAIYNNTFVGVGTGGPPIVQSSNTTLTIINNIIYNWTRAIYDYKADWSDIVSNYNMFYTTNGAVTNNSGASITLAKWQASPYTQDTNSITANPNLSATYHLQAGSLAIGSGVNLSSLGISQLSFDKDNNPRAPVTVTSHWDLGAYLYSTLLIPTITFSIN